MSAADPTPGFLPAGWPAPAGVRAGTTLRAGGVSAGPFAGLNLGGHVGDRPEDVAANRERLARLLPAAPRWLEQVHGRRVVELPGARDLRADGAWTRTPGCVCAVLTADCLPVLLCDRAGSRVAAVHAGWRGLAAGVIEAAVAAMGVPPGRLLAWLGPAIGPADYEVDRPVYEAFARSPGRAAAFAPAGPGHWRLDIYALARARLAAAGVGEAWGGGLSTAAEPDRFYSYRRDGVTGRMASLIWIEPGAGAGPGGGGGLTGC